LASASSRRIRNGLRNASALSTLMSESAASKAATGCERTGIASRPNRDGKDMAATAKLLLAALVVTVPAKGAKGDHSFSGEYRVSFLGLPVAYSQFNSTFKDGSSSVKGAFSAAGPARIFDDTKGSISSSGQIAGDVVRPARFHSDYTSGKKASTIDVKFAGGDVVSTTVTPPPKKRGSDWVAIRPGDLKDVADPLAVTMVSAESLDKVCGRKVRLYDSEMRADLTLTHVSTGQISVKGYSGPTVTCQLRFDPVSGYRKGRKAIDFVRTKSRIMVTFAPLGQTGLYAPVRATVGTEIGTITIQARRFEATG